MRSPRFDFCHDHPRVALTSNLRILHLEYQHPSSLCDEDMRCSFTTSLFFETVINMPVHLKPDLQEGYSYSNNEIVTITVRLVFIETNLYFFSILRTSLQIPLTGTVYLVT